MESEEEVQFSSKRKAKAEAEGAWDENADEEWEISSSSGNSLMNHCSLRVEESGDYVNYTFNFQCSDDCSVCCMFLSYRFFSPSPPFSS